MTDKELLAELKVCYEYINDIKENHENRFDETEEKMLWNIENQLDELYQKVYNNAIQSEYKDELKIDKDFEDEELIIGSDIYTDYNFVKKGTFDFKEDIYGTREFATCGDIDKYWYNEELGQKHNDYDYNVIANGFMGALDEMAKKEDNFDYFDKACDLLDTSNSNVLEFLDEFGSDNDE